MKNIWVLLDDAPGHMNQALGVAEALGVPFEPKTIKYNSKAKLPNLLLGASLRAIAPKEAAQIKAPWPDLVISAGRKTYPVARYIKKQHKQTKLAQIMHPGFPSGGIDLLIVPEHDGLKPSKNTLLTLGAPNRVQPDFLTQEAAIWERTLQQFASPRMAVLLGGNTKGVEYTKEDGEMLAIRVQQVTKWEGSLLISSSRRTPKAFAEAFIAGLKQPYHYHDPAKSRTNPYYAFLALSDSILVTADSVSMMSEACATGKPVYLFKPKQFEAPKHLRLVQTLLDNNYAQMADNIAKAPVVKLETSAQIAQRIRELLE